MINNNPTLYQQSLNNTQLLLKELSLPEQTKLKINDRLDVLLKESPKPIFKLLQSSTSNKGEP